MSEIKYGWTAIRDDLGLNLVTSLLLGLKSVIDRSASRESIKDIQHGLSALRVRQTHFRQFLVLQTRMKFSSLLLHLLRAMSSPAAVTAPAHEAKMKVKVVDESD